MNVTLPDEVLATAEATAPPVHIRPLVDADRRAAARVYVTCLFDEEVRPIMPHHGGRAEAVFTDLIRPSANSWVAESDGGELVGVALCQEPGGLPPSMVSWRILRRHLPLAATIRAWIVCRYLYKVRVGNDAIYLQSLVVEEQWQRRGVGATLVRFVCNEASQRGYRRVTLNVVDRNEGARRLYLRLGFRRVSAARTGLFRPLVGWGAIDSMEKTVVRS